ncbi:hypothetical protein L7F22_045741 [Adiantum nelumboides]|nr:hypothetical protein [Adiantum nelumboides]
MCLPGANEGIPSGIQRCSVDGFVCLPTSSNAGIFSGQSITTFVCATFFAEYIRRGTRASTANPSAIDRCRCRRGEQAECLVRKKNVDTIGQQEVSGLEANRSEEGGDGAFGRGRKRGSAGKLCADAIQGAKAMLVKACKHLQGGGGAACEMQHAAVQQEHLGGGTRLMNKSEGGAAACVIGRPCPTDGARGGSMARNQRLVQAHLLQFTSKLISHF